MKRNQSVEAFRCLLMFLIVFGHVWGLGIYSDAVVGMRWWTPVLMGLIIWHVDGFICISGWYGIRFSWKKFFSLWGVVLFYSVLNVGIKLAAGVPVGFKGFLPNAGWFGGSYLALMLCAPLLNAGIAALAESGKKNLFLAWCLAATAFVLSWAPFNLLTGVKAAGFESHTFVMMCFVYLTARVARFLFPSPVPRRTLLLIVAGYLTLIALYSVCASLFNLQGQVYHLFHQYQSPFIYGIALVLLMLFVWHVRIPSWMEKSVSVIAPSMFGVYLFHSFFTRFATPYSFNPLKILSAHTVLNHCAQVLVVSIVLFAGSIAVDVCVRRVLARIIKPYASRLLDRVDEKWKGVIE